MLKEAPAREGFFEPEQFESIIRHLPEYLEPVARFASITGWRTKSEILPLQWRNVDFDAGTVRLDPGTTKNDEGRMFPMTAELRELLLAQRAKADELKRTRQIISPWVFFYLKGVRAGRRIHEYKRAWDKARIAAGVPGRIMHDLRRTAIRRFERAGVARSVATRLSGHKTESVYRRYAIVSESDLREAGRKLDEKADSRKDTRKDKAFSEVG